MKVSAKCEWLTEGDFFIVQERTLQSSSAGIGGRSQAVYLDFEESRPWVTYFMILRLAPDWLIPRASATL